MKKITISSDQFGRTHLTASSGEMTVIPAGYSLAEAQWELEAFCDELDINPSRFFSQLKEFYS